MKSDWGRHNTNGVYDGDMWQCVELAGRLYLTRGWIHTTWWGNGDTIADPSNVPAGLVEQNNGSITYLQPGDVVSFGDTTTGTSNDDGGHAAIVDSVSGTTVNLINQNAPLRTQVTFSGGSLTSPWKGYYVIGVVHAPSSPPTILTSALSTGTAGRPYSATLAASGGAAPYSWSIAGGSTPPGLSLASDGTLSGVPAADGPYTFTVKVTGANRASSTASVSMRIGVSSGDFNGDGNSDLLMAVPRSNGKVNYEFGLSLGNGHFVLGTAVGLTNQPRPVAMAAGDFNGDGKSDLLMAVPRSNGKVNYEFGLSLGNGHFVLGTAVGLTNQPRPVAMAAGDFNGDGKSDLLMAVRRSNGKVNYEFGLSLGNGHFVLGTAVGLTNQPRPVAMASGDLNGDGKSDLLMAVRRSNGRVNYEFGLSLGNGHFVLGTAVGLTNQPRPVAMAAGDFNGDGKSDLLMAVRRSNGKVNYEFGLSLGNGHFVLGTAVGLTNQPRPVAMASGDLNGDGKSDLLMAVRRSNGRVNYEFGLSLGNGHFVLGTAVGLTNQPRPVTMV